MNTASAHEYVAALKQSGANDQAVVSILRNADWPEKEAVAALSAYYESLIGMPVPARPRSIGGPREAFLHLLSFITLGFWCIAAGSLWFTMIDSWLPDPSARVFGDPLAGMAYDLASVLVAFPLFLLVMRVVWRVLASQSAQEDSAIRRWLTYMALLLAAGTTMGDLVVFVEYLLNGQLTARFVSKVAVVAVLAGGVFWFYLRSVQPGGDDRPGRLRRHGRMGALVATVLVAVTLAFSFTKFGSPANQRLSASDVRRSEDLEAIANVIRARWMAARGPEAPMLPRSIAELPESATLRLTDPISREPYRYSTLGGARYQLCASFQSDTSQLVIAQRRSLFRIHPAGDYCFAVDAAALVLR
ncbi:MAG TPA: DUF5671 domain-containing protein [Bryobacteraceae bacterium]|nr:DUF5671 domain-containing protein [Bryobacteraceae bacterium]